MLLITSTEQPSAFALWFMSFNSSGGVGGVDWEGHAAEQMTGWKYNIRPLSSFFSLPRFDKPRLSKLHRQWSVHSELCTFNVSEWQSICTPPPNPHPTHSPIDSMHEPAELPQRQLHGLEFGNRFMRSAPLITGGRLYGGREGEAAHSRDAAQLIFNCFIAMLELQGCSPMLES